MDIVCIIYQYPLALKPQKVGKVHGLRSTSKTRKHREGEEAGKLEKEQEENSVKKFTTCRVLFHTITFLRSIPSVQTVFPGWVVKVL